MSYLRYLCSFAHSGVQHILCCVFFPSSSIRYVASFTGLFIFDWPFVYQNERTFVSPTLFNVQLR
jgi:hypothetical protein